MQDVVVADFNGDGINDLVVAEASDCKGNTPDTINVRLGNADGSYQPEQEVYSSSTSLAFFSVLRGNQDAKPDFVLFYIASGNQYTPGILFENTTSGNFPACSAPNHYTGITLCAPTGTVAEGSPVKFSIAQPIKRKGAKWKSGLTGIKWANN